MEAFNESLQHSLYGQETSINDVRIGFEMVKGMGAKFGVDGNQYFFMSGGDLPEPDCIVGFGDTPSLALAAYVHSFYNSRIKTIK